MMRIQSQTHRRSVPSIAEIAPASFRSKARHPDQSRVGGLGFGQVTLKLHKLRRPRPAHQTQVSVSSTDRNIASHRSWRGSIVSRVCRLADTLFAPFCFRLLGPTVAIVSGG